MGDSKSVAYSVPDNHEFIVPVKAIKGMGDMNAFKKSEAYLELNGFITSMNEAVKGKSLSVKCETSEVVKNLMQLLNKLEQMVEKYPPIEQPQRFGNIAFKTWLQHLKTESKLLLQETLPENYHKAIPEISIYLEESFGNSTRIDYGTGHEAAFVMFLCCLFKVGALQSSDKVAVVCVLFNKYLEISRNLQQTYRMEPAGSHGVWSLDDFQFVPFIWGSSQLINHPIIEPHKFLNEEILAKYGKDYMFLSCIQYINTVKTGPFAEHSNQLWGISAVPSWNKINQGLIKMYQKEVLEKFPVVQHMLFGSLLPFKPPAKI